MANKIEKTEELIETTEVEVVVEKPKKVAQQKKEPKKFAPGDTIECRSVTGGKLILIGPKTQIQYTWSDYNGIKGEINYG